MTRIKQDVEITLTYPTKVLPFDPDKITYVLRVKGQTKGHIFYDYDVDNYSIKGEQLKPFAGCEKHKYACQFDTEKEAQEKIDELIDGDRFDIVEYRQSEKDYYEN